MDSSKEAITYIDSRDGREVFVEPGLGDRTYGSFKRRPSGAKKRVSSPAMPMVDSKDEAQENLDNYARQKKWGRGTAFTTLVVGHKDYVLAVDDFLKKIQVKINSGKLYRSWLYPGKCVAVYQPVDSTAPGDMDMPFAVIAIGANHTDPEQILRFHSWDMFCAWAESLNTPDPVPCGSLTYHKGYLVTGVPKPKKPLVQTVIATGLFA